MIMPSDEEYCVLCIPDLHSMRADSKAIALVGNYMRYFALMEGVLNMALTDALAHNDELTSLVVVRNIQLSTKLSVLRALFRLAHMDADEEKKHLKTLDRIETIAREERNMVAHNSFGITDSGKEVTFSVVKARGKLSFPNVVWTFADFGKRFRELLLVTKELDALNTALQEHRTRDRPYKEMASRLLELFEDKT